MKARILMLLLALAGAAAAAPTQRPNVVFILLDNVGREWFGCYGSEEGCTPQIDRLAQGGVRFENCYTTTVCGPSRVQFLTGRYPFRTGWYLHHDAALYSGGGFDWRREVTIARVLRDAGYATGIAGKWQVNNLYDEPDALRMHGFQEALAWPGSIDRDRVDAAFQDEFQRAIRNHDADFLQRATAKIESRYWDPVVIRGGKREVLRGRFGPDVFQEFALDYLSRHRAEPFFFYHALVLTHGINATEPVTTTPENRGHPPETEREKFAGMLRYADREIGEFMATLEKLGLRDNTVVIVASDNGTERSLAARSHGRTVTGGLYQITEAGGNVALMANCPKLVPGGRVGALADSTDIFPTICDLCGVTPPDGVKLDGVSFAKFLRGEGKPPRTWIFNEYLPDRVVRDERFKLYANGKLFDLAADPDESKPLPAGASPESEAARGRLRAVLDSMPEDTPLPFPHRSLSAFRLRPAKQEP
jgi:arylsulfatase A-like enzyme